MNNSYDPKRDMEIHRTLSSLEDIVLLGFQNSFLLKMQTNIQKLSNIVSSLSEFYFIFIIL